MRESETNTQREVELKRSEGKGNAEREGTGKHARSEDLLWHLDTAVPGVKAMSAHPSQVREPLFCLFHFKWEFCPL